MLESREAQVAAAFELELLLREELRRAELRSLDLGARAELQRLEALEGILQRAAAAADAVALQHDAIVAGRELLGDLAAEIVAAGHTVGREGDLAVPAVGLRDDPRVGHALGDGERDERHRMRMDDGGQVRPHVVDGAMEGIFGRRPMAAFDGAVVSDADDVGGSQSALVDAGGSDPHVAVLVEDRQVAPRHGGHLVAVDPGNREGDFIPWMQIVVVHVLVVLLFCLRPDGAGLLFSFAGLLYRIP